jgi:glycerol-3-phosphate dehydrogenase
MLVIPTVEGTVLVGPTADETASKADFSTTSEHLEKILKSGKNMIPFVSRNDVITSFAGLRPCLQGEMVSGEDFILSSRSLPPPLCRWRGFRVRALPPRRPLANM